VCTALDLYEFGNSPCKICDHSTKSDLLWNRPATFQILILEPFLADTIVLWAYGLLSHKSEKIGSWLILDNNQIRHPQGKKKVMNKMNRHIKITLQTTAGWQATRPRIKRRSAILIKHYVNKTSQSLIWMCVYSSQSTCVEVDWSKIELNFIPFHSSLCELKWIHTGVFLSAESRWYFRNFLSILGVR
jgi:hypothetical protein